MIINKVSFEAQG